MSKAFAILLSSLILFQSLRLGSDDIMQLDELIEHAQFHKQEHGDSFIVFLSKHYGELKAEHSEKHQEEQKDHEELPFQCQNQLLTITAFVLQDSIMDSDSTEATDSSESNFHYASSFSTLHKKGLLQPPKQV
jgi:hypothetical protein